ncbi:MAG: HEAT repeat domain-containing protein [Cyanobacteria bacterium]|nr:HEAT repeat domain-containing protein [Cyanobacteriota bacterium]MDA0864821.1 HEAT repeat domain-containing protein [Cyanobacteriota bacterium]
MSHALSKLLDAIDKADSAASLSDAVQDLADACLIESAPNLIEALSYNNPGAAVAAVNGLVQLGEATVPALLEQLDRNNYTARAWAIRALASIGDPRGLLTLLGAATADISMSVRRAAARGLGNMKWHQFPPKFLGIAQTEALDALLFVAQQDEEWVVRYAGVVGLESLAISSQPDSNPRRSQIQRQLALMANQEESPAVRARIWQAQQQLQKNTPSLTDLSQTKQSALSSTDWEQILTRLYNRKLKERTVLNAGDPIYYRDLVSPSIPARVS